MDEPLEVYVGVLMTRCPLTGRQIETGIETDRKTFNALPSFVSTVQCPVCDARHQWSLKDAWLCESLAYPNVGQALWQSSIRGAPPEPR
ncbi:MAG TPA: hypothetical protein VEL48_10040 [Candidatus Acidoferrales bacterium]|nr:hypothetical protein [Candidatus Acidoferrales bacterium]